MIPAISIIALAGAALTAAATASAPSLVTPPPMEGRQDTAWIRTPSGLTYAVLREGSGAVARAGVTATIHETVTLRNGSPVFSTRDKDTPVTFLLGGNQVIAGLEEGVTGMRVGERRVFIIPPSLSKRTSYPASTPKDSTLRIDLELIAVGK